MRYEGDIYRPPSEARSLILQATVGCSHNRCTFCAMYKNKTYRERSLEELTADIKYASGVAPGTRRIFLADGNSLHMPSERLIEILELLNEYFPYLERVSVYSNPQDLLDKEVNELIRMRELKLGMIYLGVESGSHQVLRDVKKGSTPEEMINGARKTKQAEIPLSITAINGLAGREGMEEHARKTAWLLNEMDPEYLGLLTLMVYPGFPIYRRISAGELTMLEPWEVLAEILLMVKDLNLTSCVFRANHASNYLPLKAVLSRDKDALMAKIEKIIEEKNPAALREEWRRGL